MSMKLRYFAFAVLFSACAVGPDYKRPDMEVPADFSARLSLRNGSAGAPEAQKPDYCRWWENFNDPVLNELITFAIQENLDSKLAEARVREARALLTASYSLLSPDLDTSASATRSKTSKNANSSNQSQVVDTETGETNVTSSRSGIDRNLYQAGFDAAWEIDIWGGERRRIEQVRDVYEAQVEVQRDVLVTLLSEVAQNYVMLRGIQHQLQIVHRNVQAERETLELQRMRLDAGITNDLTVAQAETQLANTAAQSPTLNTQMHQAIHRLSVLLNLEPGALEAKLTVPAELPLGPTAVPPGLPSDLILRRPDVRTAERQLAAATANIGVATADLFPKLSLTGTLGLRSEELSSFTEHDSVYYSIGSIVSWPILQLRPIYYNIQIQNIRQEQALLAYRQAVLQSLEEVDNALIALDREKDRNALLAQAVQSSRRALSLAKELNEAGIEDFLNVLTAQLAVFQAEDQLARSDQALLTNVIALYKALGGGWETEIPVSNG